MQIQHNSLNTTPEVTKLKLEGAGECQRHRYCRDATLCFSNEANTVILKCDWLKWEGKSEPVAAYFASKWVRRGRLIAGKTKGRGKIQKRLLNALFLSLHVVISVAEIFHRLGRLQTFSESISIGCTRILRRNSWTFWEVATLNRFLVKSCVRGFSI